MRSREFMSETSGTRDITINIPITVTIPSGGGDPQIGTPDRAAVADEQLLNAVMVSPLQQELELFKQQGGKRSAVINQIIADNGALSNDQEDEEIDVEAESVRQVQRQLTPKPLRPQAAPQNYIKR